MPSGSVMACAAGGAMNLTSGVFVPATFEARYGGVVAHPPNSRPPRTRHGGSIRRLIRRCSIAECFKVPPILVLTWPKVHEMRQLGALS